MTTSIVSHDPNPDVGSRIALAFEELRADAGDCDEYHDSAHAVYRHGQWWIRCPGCGSQWSVEDYAGGEAVSGEAVDGFFFRLVVKGASENKFTIELVVRGNPEAAEQAVRRACDGGLQNAVAAACENGSVVVVEATVLYPIVLRTPPGA